MQTAFYMICLLATTILMHLLADYPLQGILASMKQKKWWGQNAPGPMYKRDWVAGLICHSAMWGIMCAIPSVAVCCWLGDWAMGVATLGLMAAAIALHCAIDDLKANRRAINLLQDQSLHILQLLALCAPACAALSQGGN